MRSSVSLETVWQPAVFETFKVAKGKVVMLEPHLERLVASARSVSPSFAFSLSRVRRELLEEIGKSRLREGSVRLTVVQVAGGRHLSFAVVRPPRKIPDRWIRNGVSIETTATRRNTIASVSGEIKAREYHNGLLSVLEGLDREEIFERIYLDRQGYVCEGTVTNLFILRSEQLLTAPCFLGVLAGVTRSSVIALARRQGLSVEERPFTRFELYTASEVFLTNSSLGILPVCRADARVIGEGRTGRWTFKLMKAYRKEFN